MPEKIIIFATGTKTKGGSGARKLIQYFRSGKVAVVVGIVSNHPDGGVAKIAQEFGIPFLYVSNQDLTPEMYESIPKHFGAPRAWCLLSGWMRFVYTKIEGKWGRILDMIGRNLRGLLPSRTINIHPALLSQLNGRFGGKNMWGHHVHEAVYVARLKGELDVDAPNHGVAGDDRDDRGRYDKLVDTTVEREVVPYSGLSMHFVIGHRGPEEDYDRGPVFAEIRVPITGMDADAIGSTVNRAEHRWQSLLTEMVITQRIRLVEGKVIVPLGYGLLPKSIDPRFA